MLQVMNKEEGFDTRNSHSTVVKNETQQEQKTFEELMKDFFQVKYEIYQAFFFNPWYNEPNESSGHLWSFMKKI